MLRRGFARFLIVALLLLGLVTVAGYFGWSQGYDAGLANIAGEGATRFGPMHDGFAWTFFGIGLFFKLILFTFMFFLITRIFFFWRHNPGREHDGGPWGGHRHGGWRRRGHGRHPDDGEDDEEVTHV